MSTAESQRDEVHAAKVRKTKEQLMFIFAFRTDVPLIVGGLNEGKYLTIPLMLIRTQEL